MTPAKVAILVLFSAIVGIATFVMVDALTHTWRAWAGAIVLALATGSLIWFGTSRQQMIGRGIMALAATVIAAPTAGLMAAQNDFLYGFIANPDATLSHFEAYDALFARGLRMAGIGLAAGIVLFFVGWRVHRAG
ncbi:hypothetical protein [Hasllibacter sp. MH4015]|uniref:hypothetical protein n=1 Tax=Hasllibacter sp. MH4015 TaxID=2854029 RepID=UPI001CD45727|nr:hypothetical protein [Hasllibacter sp. MH4015]